MKLVKLLFTVINIVYVLANTITTTLNSIEQRSVAVIEQATFINELLKDAVFSKDRYTSVMVNQGIDFPPELVQFMLQINTVQVNSFPTSEFIKSFPFTQFATFITNFPWVTTFLNENGMIEFKVPSDYQVMTITQTDENVINTQSVTGVESNVMMVSSTQMTFSTPSTTIISSQVASTSAVTSKSSNVAIPTSFTFSSFSSSSSSFSSASIQSLSSTSHNEGNILATYIPYAIFACVPLLI
jgi:hypothetical protein